MTHQTYNTIYRTLQGQYTNICNQIEQAENFNEVYDQAPADNKPAFMKYNDAHIKLLRGKQRGAKEALEQFEKHENILVRGGRL